MQELDALLGVLLIGKTSSIFENKMLFQFQDLAKNLVPPKKYLMFPRRFSLSVSNFPLPKLLYDHFEIPLRSTICLASYVVGTVVILQVKNYLYVMLRSTQNSRNWCWFCPWCFRC